MSTVKADNFTWKTGQANGLSGTNVTGDQIVYGVAKSWLNYNSSSSVINKSYNISSVTKNGTGDTTANFTNSFSDNYYTIAGSNVGSTVSYYYSVLLSAGIASSSSLTRFVTVHIGGTVYDQTVVSVTFDR